VNLRPQPRLRRLRNGTYAVHLPPEERALLAVLPQQLLAALELLESDDDRTPDSARRILPIAHPRDAAAEEDYVRRHRPALLARHMESLDLIARTAESNKLSAEELDAWLTAINDLRLALGVTLEVTEEQVEPDPDSPDFADWIVYFYLSFLQGELLEVLSDDLPPPTPGAGEDLPEDPWGDPLGGLRWDGTPLPPQDHSRG
jgi:Domain of unknown function (DUF2017)